VTLNYVKTKTPGGYIMEASIPFEKIKYDPQRDLPIAAK